MIIFVRKSIYNLFDWMKKITFVPVGGLANRMRAIASVTTLAEKTHSGLDVIWFQDWALNAPFSRLFEPISCVHLSMRNASLGDFLFCDRPRKHNLFVPRLFQLFAFDDCIYERSFYSLIKNGFDFEAWMYKKNNVYMASYSAFQQYESDLISKLFVPIEEIRHKVNIQSCLFTENVIGVHVRRGDNVWSIEQSPLQLFYEKLDLEIDNNERTIIYLATDSEEVKVKMKERYGQRVSFQANSADRSSVSGIQDGIVDMYTLAKTKKIYGSFQSSFSEMAAQISGIPLEILCRK